MILCYLVTAPATCLAVRGPQSRVARAHNRAHVDANMPGSRLV